MIDHRGAYTFLKLMFLFSLSKYPKVELLDNMVIQLLTFSGATYCFPLQVYHFTFPSTDKGSNLLTSSPTLDIFWVFFL